MERNRIARLIRRKVEFRVEEDARLEDVAECTRKEFLQREPASSAHIQASVGSGEVVKHVAVQARFCAESNCVHGNAGKIDLIRSKPGVLQAIRQQENRSRIQPGACYLAASRIETASNSRHASR